MKQRLNCENFGWDSFMCLPELSSVLKGQILSYYPDVGDVNHKYLFICNISPRTSNVNQKCFRILFCRNEAFGTFFKSEKFQSNHFVPLLPTIQKRKKSNPSHTSSASKKIYLKLPKMGSLASRFEKGKQSKLEFKPCLKPLFVSSKVSLPQQYHLILIVSNIKADSHLPKKIVLFPSLKALFHLKSSFLSQDI